MVINLINHLLTGMILQVALDSHDFFKREASWEVHISRSRGSALPEAELKRVLGEGGVHGLEEVGKRGQEDKRLVKVNVEGSWEDDIVLVALVVQQKVGCVSFIDFFWKDLLRIGESNVHQ